MGCWPREKKTATTLDERRANEVNDDSGRGRKFWRIPRVRGRCRWSKQHPKRRDAIVVVQSRGRFPLGHSPVSRIYVVDVRLSRASVRVHVSHVPVVLRVRPNAAVRAVLCQRSLGDMLDDAVREHYRRGKRTSAATRRSGGVRREPPVVHGHFQFVPLETTV